MWLCLNDAVIKKTLELTLAAGYTEFRDRFLHYSETTEKKREAAYRKAAEELFHSEGELEIDESAVVSLDDTVPANQEEGAYVMAWVWVPRGNIRKPRKKRIARGKRQHRSS